MLVVGPGALGVIIAVRLQNAGNQVEVAARDAKSARALPPRWEAIDASGVSQTAAVAVVASPRSAGPYDAIILATKCDDAPPALHKWLQTLASDGVVVALQNGIIGDQLAPMAGDRLVECTVAFPATLLGPGRSEQTGPGTFVLGPWPDGRMADATPLDIAARLMADVAPTRAHRNMRGVKWTKLCMNSAITGLGALTGGTLGDIVDTREGRNALLHVITEGYRAGQAHGVQFERINGFHPQMVAVGKPGRLALARRHAILRIIGRKYRRQRSSSLQSLDRGRRTEVHHLNGVIVQAATEMDLSAPVNGAVVKMVQEIEAGTRKPEMGHLAALPFRFH